MEELRLKYKNYSSVTEFFDVLNKAGILYVVLRNYENMHEKSFFTEGHEDIDLLVADVDSFIETSRAIPKMWPEDKIHLLIFIDGQAVPLDVRRVGDGYYDKPWEEIILNKRTMGENGCWYVMDDENYYYSLVYHSILQKSQLGEEYLERLNTMAKQVGVSCRMEREHLLALDDFMKRKEYEYTLPDDGSVCLRFHGREYGRGQKQKISIKIPLKKIKNFLKKKGANLAKKLGIYHKCKQALYRQDVQMKNGRIKTVDRLATKIQKKYGENVYDQIAQRKIYNYLDRYNTEIESMYEHQRSKQILKKKPLLNCPIFTMWWQGEDKRPDVVKACNASLQKLNREVVILTEDNIHEYIDLPEYIWEKYSKGFISRTHLSDIVRVTALAMYGGVWIDSTVYVANDVPNYMTESLFVFKQSPQLREIRSYANWWIAAPPQHEMILRQLSALLVYWKNEDLLLDYYIFHIFWRKILDQNVHLKKEIDDIPTRITDSTHLLLRNYKKEFNENEWREFKAISPVFKCTYKWKGLDSINTYYSKLCQGLLP